MATKFQVVNGKLTFKRDKVLDLSEDEFQRLDKAVRAACSFDERCEWHRLYVRKRKTLPASVLRAKAYALLAKAEARDRGKTK